ncbi:polysaccharide pyruvyl transferase family protein [Thermodesulfobacteriota bacterium]
MEKTILIAMNLIPIHVRHFACPGRNAGDNALIDGLIHSFAFMPNIRFRTMNLRRTVFTRDFIQQLNRNADMVLIGGGGLLHAPMSIRKKTDNTSGTLIELSKENMDRFTVPLVIYGVGFNVFPGEKTLPDIARDALLKLIEVSDVFTVRNDGSKKRLMEYLGCEIPKVKSIPDPGLYVNSIESDLSNNVTSEINVAIQIAADRLEYRFKNSEMIDAFVNGLCEIINKHSDITFWLVPHVKKDAEFIKKRMTKNRANIVPLLSKTKKDACKIMGFYKKMTLVAGQRGHAIICPFGLGVPVISLVSHDKNKEFMKEVGFPEFAIDVNNSNFVDLFSNLLEKVISNNSEIRVKQNQELSALAKQTQEINKNIVSLAQKNIKHRLTSCCRRGKLNISNMLYGLSKSKRKALKRGY